MSDTWTIGELAERAARALRDSAAPTANGRVRDVPGERLIRWYTTIGLVDPPLTRRGRIARYGRRHLLQLVAVKRLQAAGRSIAEIQAALAGATDRMLETAAGLTTPPDAPPDALPDVPARPAAGAPPPNAPPMPGAPPAPEAPAAPGALPARGAPSAPGAPFTPGALPTPGAPPAPGARGDGGRGQGPQDGDEAPDDRARTRFWAEHPGSEVPRGAGHRDDADGPATPAPGAGDADRPPAGTTATPEDDGTRRAVAAAGRRGAAAAGRRAGAEVAGVVTGVVLAEGVRLVLDTGRAPSEEDVQAVLAAAGPLLAVLEERQLT